MPKKTTKKEKAKSQSFKKVCDNCKREIASTQFYNTNSVLSVDGKLNICKVCVKSMIDYNKIETIYNQIKDVY